MQVFNDYKPISISFLAGLLSIGFLLMFLMPLSSGANSLGKTVPVTNTLLVPIGQSTLIKLKGKPERIALSNPGIAYVQMITPDQLQIIGRNRGRTNLYAWFPQESKANEPKKPSIVIGTEISVELPKPPSSGQGMEIIYGTESSDLVINGNNPEIIRNSRPGRVSGPASDMPEPCLSPGCI